MFGGGEISVVSAGGFAERLSLNARKKKRLTKGNPRGGLGFVGGGGVCGWFAMPTTGEREKDMRRTDVEDRIHRHEAKSESKGEEPARTRGNKHRTTPRDTFPERWGGGLLKETCGAEIRVARERGSVHRERLVVHRGGTRRERASRKDRKTQD